MKGQRIKYEKVLSETGMTIYRSQDFILDKEVVRVVLTPSEESFQILSESDEVLKAGRSKNFTVLRSIARKALKELGINITDEVRKRLG